MKKLLAVSALVTVFGVGSMFAAQISGGTVTAGPTSFDYGDGGGDPTVALTFSQFAGCANCVLTGIEFDISGTANTTANFTNNNAGTKSDTINTAATFQLVSTNSSVTFSETLPSSSKTVMVAGGGGTASPTNSATAAGSAIYNASGALVSVGGTAVATDLTNPINVSVFLGSGTITLDALGQNSTSLSASGTQSESQTGTGSETVTILYSYTVSSTPEPATMTLFGSALLGLGFFARKRLKS